jgi:hypothetical protein
MVPRVTTVIVAHNPLVLTRICVLYVDASRCWVRSGMSGRNEGAFPVEVISGEPIPQPRRTAPSDEMHAVYRQRCAPMAGLARTSGRRGRRRLRGHRADLWLGNLQFDRGDWIVAVPR